MNDDFEFEDPEDTQPVSRFVRVRLLTNTVHQGCYLVVNQDDLSQAWLVPTSELELTLADQHVTQSLLDRCVRPYNWTAEIQAIMPTVDSVRLAIWRNGILSLDDVQKPSNARQALYGAFPTRLL